MKKRNVGAGPVSAQRGITLIALIITIIVMLILVGVTVSFTIGENGILNQAKTSKIEHEKAGEKDILAIETIACYDYKEEAVDGEKLKQSSTLEQWEIRGEGPYICESPKGNLFKVFEDGAVIELNLTPVEKYLLGDKAQGKKITQIVNLENGQFIDDPTTPDVNEAEYGIEPLDVEHCGGEEDVTFMQFIQYDNKIYTMEIIYGENFPETSITNGELGLKLVYDKQIETNYGKYVRYKDEDWMIIYDNPQAGLQMVSLEALTLPDGNNVAIDYKIDWQSEKVKKEANIFNDGEELSDVEKSIYSYNNAIQTLNTACKDIVGEDENIIKDVRSIGSNPIDKTIENKKWYKSEFLATLPKNNEIYKPGAVNGKIYSSDENWIIDYERMAILEINHEKNNQNYWTATRITKISYNYSGDPYGILCSLYAEIGKGTASTVFVLSDKIQVSKHMLPCRPVITLKPNVLDNATGDGSQSNPYVL